MSHSKLTTSRNKKDKSAEEKVRKKGKKAIDTMQMHRVNRN